MDKIRSIKDFIELKPKYNNDEIEAYLKSHTFDITKIPDNDYHLVFIDECPIGSRESIIAITGRSKSRKTIAASAIATSFFSKNGHLKFNSRIPENGNILHIDTEQGYLHYYYSVKRIFDDADLSVPPERFHSFYTRDGDVEFLIKVIEHLLETLKPIVFILDGVTDMVYDLNDQEEAVRIGRKILQWTTVYNMLFVGIIHTTKSTGYMTGAIGTFLEKKAETVIKVELDEDDNLVSHISGQYTRNKPFESFSIKADGDNHYSITQEFADKPTIETRLPDEFPDHVHTGFIDLMFAKNQYIMSKKIESELIKIFPGKMTHKTAKIWIEKYQSRFWLNIDSEGKWFRPITKPDTTNPQIAIDNFVNDDVPF